jgi:hypothetical protein
MILRITSWLGPIRYELVLPPRISEDDTGTSYVFGSGMQARRPVLR